MNIIIIGGGISGLSCLHYLKAKYSGRSDVHVTLFEKNAYLGGTARSEYHGQFVFETGPNGFLSSRANMLEFVRELDFENELLTAQQESQRRFILFNDRLQEIPNGFIGFLSFRPLSFLDKLRILAEPFIPAGKNPDESVYEFGKRRLGENFSRVFLDCLVTGIFGGDVRELNLRFAFPRIYEIEQKYGSLFKGMFFLGVTKKRKAGDKRFKTQPAGTLTSFNRGMSQLSDTLRERYKDSIRLDEGATEVMHSGNRFTVKTKKGSYPADEIFVCTPAFHAAEILAGLNAALCGALRKIPYAPIAVVGLAYKKSAFAKLPSGFGYLIPSGEQKSILGVLLDSNIFPSRCGQEHLLMRVLVGGARNQDIAARPSQQLVEMAKQEIHDRLEARENPTDEFFFFWPKAIPQYNAEYPQLMDTVTRELEKIKGLHLVANYVGGVALSDCVSRAKKEAEAVKF